MWLQTTVQRACGIPGCPPRLRRVIRWRAFGRSVCISDSTVSCRYVIWSIAALAWLWYFRILLLNYWMTHIQTNTQVILVQFQRYGCDIHTQNDKKDVLVKQSFKTIFKLVMHILKVLNGYRGGTRMHFFKSAACSRLQLLMKSGHVERTYC